MTDDLGLDGDHDGDHDQVLAEAGGGGATTVQLAASGEGRPKHDPGRRRPRRGQSGERRRLVRRHAAGMTDTSITTRSDDDTPGNGQVILFWADN